MDNTPFTEQGVYMLMIVLKGELAINQGKALDCAFKEMKDFIIDNRSLIGNRELLRLSVQTTQNRFNFRTSLWDANG